MTIVVEQLDNDPIIVATIFEPVDMAVDPQKNRELCNEIARKYEGKVYRIIDFTHFELTFSQMVMGLAEDIRLSERNIVPLIVGNTNLVRLQAEAMKQEQYGGFEAKVFTSVDAAIAYAREQLAG